MMPPRIGISTNVVRESDALLLAVEFGDIPFQVKRIFTVQRTGELVTRGNHFACGFQQIFLLAGSVDLHLKKVDQEVRNIHFTEIGSSILVAPDDYVSYELLEAGSQILVLADQSYKDSIESRARNS